MVAFDGSTDDGDSDDTFNTKEDPTTAAFSKGLAAVNKILMYGRQSYGLPAQGAARLGGTGGGVSAGSRPYSGGDWRNWNTQAASRDNINGGGGGSDGSSSNNSDGGYSSNNSDNSGDSGDDNSDDSGSDAGSGDYARGGLVKGYDDGGEVTSDDDPFDIQNDPSPAPQEEPDPQIADPQSEEMPEGAGQQQAEGMLTGSDQPDWRRMNEPRGELSPTRRLNQTADMGGSMRNAGRSIMDYLHGIDGWSKEQVDAALANANSDQVKSTNQFAQANSSGPTQRDDEDPFDTQNDPSAPRQTKPVPPTKLMQPNSNDDIDPFDTQNDPDAPQAKPTPSSTMPQETKPFTESIGKFGAKDEPSSSQASDSGFSGKENTTTASDSGFTDSSAVKALQQALEQGGEEHGHGLMQGMRKLWNAFLGHAAAAATGSPEKPANLEQAANSANLASKYLPVNDKMNVVSNGDGTLTVRTTDDKGKETAHTMSPDEFAAAMNPGTGAQFDKTIHKGPTQTINDVRTQQAGNPFNNPAAGRFGGDGTQQRLSQKNAPPRDNTNPGAVTIRGWHGQTTNGWGERIGSNDPRTIGNQKAAHKLQLEKQKGDDAYDRAELRAKSAQGVADTRAKTSGENNQRTNETRQRGQDIGAQTAANRLAADQKHWDSIAQRSMNSEQMKNYRAAVQANPSADRAELFKQAMGMLPPQANVGMQNAPAGPAAPAAPQPRPPNVPQGAKQYNGKWYTRGPNGEAVEVK